MQRRGILKKLEKMRGEGARSLEVLQNTFEELWNACLKATFGVEMVAQNCSICYFLSFPYT